MEESSTPPVPACLYISWTVRCRQFILPRGAQSDFTILMALVGQKLTQR